MLQNLHEPNGRRHGGSSMTSSFIDFRALLLLTVDGSERVRPGNAYMQHVVGFPVHIPAAVHVPDFTAFFIKGGLLAFPYELAHVRKRQGDYLVLPLFGVPIQIPHAVNEPAFVVPDGHCDLFGHTLTDVSDRQQSFFGVPLAYPFDNVRLPLSFYSVSREPVGLSRLFKALAGYFVGLVCFLIGFFGFPAGFSGFLIGFARIPGTYKYAEKADCDATPVDATHNSSFLRCLRRLVFCAIPSLRSRRKEPKRKPSACKADVPMEVGR